MQSRLHKYLVRSALIVCAAVLLPTLAYAQAQIVGQVRDESGGVLPGVTVEAASPAIIEKVRTAVTDDQGRYRIDALRPGIYKLTFSLTGFSTVARESIEVPSEVVVTINADMKVGALEETITVSGETPQIDVQQASRTQVITRDIIDTLPVSRNVMSIGVLSAGVRAGTPDIGGSRMTEQVNLRAHGLAGEDAEQLVEGMSIQSLEGASQSYFDDMLQSEITIMTSAIPADTSGGGIRMNSVLKDGGNMFSGSAFLGFSSGEWQSDNVDDALRAAPNSIRSANGIKHIHMFTGSIGGPIKRDKLWFIVTARHQSSDETVADVPVQITTPQGEIINSYLDTYVRGPSLRMTWQAAPKHKLASFVQRWWKRKGRTFAAGQDPRTGQFRDPSKAHHTVGNIKYTSPLTNKLLFEGGYSWTLFDWHGGPDVGIMKERGHAGVVCLCSEDLEPADGRSAVRLRRQLRRDPAGLHRLGIEPQPAAGQHAHRLRWPHVVCHRLAQRQVRLYARNRAGRHAWPTSTTAISSSGSTTAWPARSRCSTRRSTRRAKCSTTLRSSCRTPGRSTG